MCTMVVIFVIVLFFVKVGISWERCFDAAVAGVAEKHVGRLPPPVMCLACTWRFMGSYTWSYNHSYPAHNPSCKYP